MLLLMLLLLLSSVYRSNSSEYNFDRVSEMVKVEVECPSVEAPFGRDGAEPKEILIEDVG